MHCPSCLRVFFFSLKTAGSNSAYTTMSYNESNNFVMHPLFTRVQHVCMPWAAGNPEIMSRMCRASWSCHGQLSRETEMFILMRHNCIEIRDCMGKLAYDHGRKLFRPCKVYPFFFSFCSPVSMVLYHNCIDGHKLFALLLNYSYKGTIRLVFASS